MWEAVTKGFQSIAAGKAGASLGAQSPHMPNAVTRIGRFLYSASALWIGGIWYLAYANMRTQTGQGPTLILPGGKVINSPDRPDRVPAYSTSTSSPTGTGSNQYVATPNSSGRKLIALSPNQLGVPGTAIPGYLWSAPNNMKQFPAYNKSAYTSLLNVASKIAQHFGLTITSGYRPTGNQDLHNSGLAFDMVGTLPQMKAAASWAAKNPALFQEIFIHNEGSGLHLHLGFYPNAVTIFNAGSNGMVRPTQSPQRVR